MSIDKSNMISAIQSNIDSATSSCDTCDLVALSAAVNATTTDRKNTIALGCDLPDLYAGNTPEGTTYYVQEFGVPVVATDICWAGLDGRTYRDDSPTCEIYAWGFIGNGLSGSDTITSFCYSSPVLAAQDIGDWVSMCAAVYFRTHAIKSNGTLWSWGGNGSSFCIMGLLALNTSDSTVYSSPVQEFTSSTNWSKVSGAYYSSAGLKTDGTIWAWGCNYKGIIGNNCHESQSGPRFYSSPVQEASSSTDWCTVSMGNRTASAIKTDGTLWNWGSFFCWGLTCAGLTDTSSPIQEITSSTNWCFTATGTRTTQAIKTDGTLWGWGQQVCAILGTGDLISHCVPKQEFCSATNWCYVDNGYSARGIKSDGTLWSWGPNSSAILGVNNGNSFCQCSPRQEYCSATNWSNVKAANIHAVATKSDGTLWTWGYSCYGVLGLGTSGSSTPGYKPCQEISSSTDWVLGDTNQTSSYGLKIKV